MVAHPPDAMPTPDADLPIYVISVAAQLSGLHPQTLRQYDRLGLVSPGRSAGRSRRYSLRDIAMLREVQRLSQEEGVNLAGIKRILELESEVDALHDRLEGALAELATLTSAASRYESELAASYQRRYLPVPVETNPTALVVWRPTRR
jgi:MerR family transcriptional regulator/heat shock protein HspR